MPHQEFRCDSVIPRYDLRSWQQVHGKALPDHPAIFNRDAATAWQAFNDFPDVRRFFDRYGDAVVRARPEYAQAGGSLALFGDLSKVERRVKVRELVSSGTTTPLYYNDFDCEEFCQIIKDSIDVPALFAGPVLSTNLLLGGHGTGLPFHKHQKTWQGLLFGRKAWFVVPPLQMSRQLQDLTGPYTYPVRFWKHSALKLPLGQRPLYCEQLPGEIFYVPRDWWHATLNIGELTLAYGEKPSANHEDRQLSEEALRIMRYFDPVLSPSEYSSGFTFHWVERSLRAEKLIQEGKARHGVEILEQPLRQIRVAAKQGHHFEGIYGSLNDTASFAHCVVAERFRNLLPTAAARWQGLAKKLSFNVYSTHCEENEQQSEH